MTTIAHIAAKATRISRRSFLGRSGSLGLSMAALGQILPLANNTLNAAAADKKSLFGSNVYGWTQYYQRDKKPFNLDEVIAALADSGYDYLENFMDSGKPEVNVAFADKLRAKGMRPVSLYTGGNFHEDGKAQKTVAKLVECCKVCKKAGFEIISCNPDPIGREKTDAELKTQVASLIEFGKELNKMGMKLGIHHHLPEMKSNAREFHYVFRNSPPKVVGLCYDVHWVFKGGIAPMEALKEYGKRVVTWHLRQSRNNVWWEDMDTGDVDYEAVANYARKNKMPRRFTVELALEGGTQITRSGVENHRRSLEYIKKVFGA